MGDTSKVHPSKTMAKDGGTNSDMTLKEKGEKSEESDFGIDEKKDEEENKPAEMVPYSDLVRKEEIFLF